MAPHRIIADQTKLAEFFFSTPLYRSIDISDDLSTKALFMGYNKFRVDGYCSYCKKDTTFESVGIKSIAFLSETQVDELKKQSGIFRVEIRCARVPIHAPIYFIYLANDKAQKIGQYPSLADIAIDEASVYKKYLDNIDARELHRAIGLAAHGVGIGSFVYLRRVFERLIKRRFDEYKASEGWEDSTFRTISMEEKISLLKDHLPHFLVENKRIYSILSLGVHELSEEQCLAFFDALKLSIKFILEDDKKKREELELREAAKKAIASFKQPEQK